MDLDVTDNARLTGFPARVLASYACDEHLSRGRLQPLDRSPTRSEFQRDRDRIIHSTAFRRLAHKTQVFVHHEGDHYRSRLTHTIEVAQIARALARTLRLDEDLAEALALAHDLGHTPFGHSGEDALHICMREFGGFDHNAQALRIVTRLERRYAGHDGLNLTWETLEGLVKHNGPLFSDDGAPAGRYVGRGVPAAITEYDALHPLGLATFASAEAQVAAIADDVAYDAHDIDDGLRAGLFAIDDLREVDFLAVLIGEVDTLYPGLDSGRRGHELVRRIITRFVEDIGTQSSRNLGPFLEQNVDAIRLAPYPVIAFAPAMQEAEADVKAFLFARMYRHPKVMGVRNAAEGIVRDLFSAFFNDPLQMPEEWRAQPASVTDAKRARRVSDYIAGMTDRYALQAHRALFDATPELR